MLLKALNFEKISVPKLIYPKFDEQAVDGSLSSGPMSPDSSNINDVDECIKENEDIHKNVTCSKKILKENLTGKSIPNEDWDKTAPIAQQIIIKYSGQHVIIKQFYLLCYLLIHSIRT